MNEILEILSECQKRHDAIKTAFVAKLEQLGNCLAEFEKILAGM